MAENVADALLELAKQRARDMSRGSRRKDIPVRSRFIRALDTPDGGTADTPLTRLVRAGDSDGLTLRLYLALLWRCSAEPYSTEIQARLWAELLTLPGPLLSQKRRVSEALKRLAREKLIVLESRPGRAPIIGLLDESGDGTLYAPPRGSKDPAKRWVKVPTALWQNDAFHQLTTPGLAMLLAILAEAATPTSEVWWSVDRFQRRIGLTPATRARGTKQLVDGGFLHVHRTSLGSSTQARFAPEHSRNVYTLTL